jgi:isoamylase
VKWSSLEGSPQPQGVTWIPEERAFNFALYSKHAGGVTLLLYRAEDLVRPQSTHRLDFRYHKTGRVWHCRIPLAVVEQARFYAYQVEPPDEASHPWERFDPEKILLDPYARDVFFPPEFDRGAAIGPGTNAGRAPLGVLPLPAEPPFDWGTEPTPRHEGNAVVYEMHVRGFTRHPSSEVDEANRGTYLGVIEKIPYLLDLGVTVVELMPIFQFDPQEGSCWGYMPINVFAPHAGYASSVALGAALDEFRRMVRAFHENGIEVVIDVVYNHTAEGDHAGPTYSHKGVDNSTYYLMTHDSRSPYANFSGTGNTLHAANYYVRKMILDSLRYWVEEMHVDGFRFDLASVFSRRADGSLDPDGTGIFAEIASDPVLSGVRLIAEPWDAAGANQLGRALPGISWAQWNARFRDDVRRFVRGDEGMVDGIMRRIYGSDDLFPDERRTTYRPSQSVNYVTSHDGFTLYDLVAYEWKRNWANGEENRDGTDENLSWNCGWEGDDDVPTAVLELRRSQARFFAALLLLSNGTPMIRAGDEFLQTQRGNNNPFNQDNEITWLDWSRLDAFPDVHRFFREMIRFRKSHPTICRSRFWREDVTWFGTDGRPHRTEESRTLAYHLDGGACGDTDLLVFLNASPDAVAFRLPDGLEDGWRLAIDTAADSPHDIRTPGEEPDVREPEVTVSPRSLLVLIGPPPPPPLT